MKCFINKETGEQVLIFSAERFKKDSRTRGLLSKKHIEACDGLEVEFDKDVKFGRIPFYKLDGEEFYLYPVEKEWCSDQINLF